jgi:hypothetical protein
MFRMIICKNINHRSLSEAPSDGVKWYKLPRMNSRRYVRHNEAIEVLEPSEFMLKHREYFPALGPVLRRRPEPCFMKGCASSRTTPAFAGVQLCVHLISPSYKKTRDTRKLCQLCKNSLHFIICVISFQTRVDVKAMLLGPVNQSTPV